MISNRREAEQRLQDSDNGTFIVRNSSVDPELLSLSFKSEGKPYHARIQCNAGGWDDGNFQFIIIF